ncbi:MAG: hypothetical protein INR68_18475 [Methylobacterium mesophilicum]|nr:hypothetical protein [Methylobacterium mesophilicum]
MTNKAPPVPPQNRSPKGPGGAEEVDTDTSVDDRHAAPNTASQGQAGTTKVNTTHQGNRRSS